jgi:hypothetical protein
MRFLMLIARLAYRLGLNLNYLVFPVLAWRNGEPFLLRHMRR